ncbi:MAG: hypothetical protein A3D50_00035 [Candidatus Taylorbacteria bacterium RIFCSPHIGHO2_02_FULL_44_12]|uniref:General secretion pathway GspH domain-containing protein n=1 Tax=Candidatus Taylorbacteria bacterium RIFCSPHIGHO2_02_FULL_44_12 TaxID=1802308 RepID=A0A1G2MN17_9BACT|nr:MAG: hypothetical protein A3D50_00035 [Candidatus Taylorbacteria bacterium RIFCSPHIGHO2_02_FULL_44_12]
MSSTKHFIRRGFTLVELMVSLGIFTFMTLLLVTKYGNFNQSVLLTDLAYDVALTIRTAQTYGLSVKNAGTGTNPFQYSYGVDFSPETSGLNNNRVLTFFVDINGNNYYDGGDLVVSTYSIKRGAKILSVCSGSGPGSCTAPSSPAQLDVTFKRPNPDAIICANGVCGSSYAMVTLEGTGGGIRTVVVRDNGQISVGE